MEHMPRGSLRDVLTLDDELGWFTKERIMLDITNGLAYVHSQDKAHGNLKSGNVLLDDSSCAKLSDFGPSVVKGGMDTVAHAHGSVDELQRNDIYALGEIMSELRTQRRTDCECGSYHEVDPPYFINLAARCLQDDHRHRPSAADIVRELQQAPGNILESIFGPENLSTLYLKQSDYISNCRDIASLHCLKKKPFAASIFGRLITEKSHVTRSDPLTFEQASRNGWRVYFAPPFDKRPVDVEEGDLEKVLYDNDGSPVDLLEYKHQGDKILLVAASRWRKHNGSTDSVEPQWDTFGQGVQTRETLQFLKLCLNDQIAKEYSADSNASSQPLSNLRGCYVYSILNRFSWRPSLFLFTAGTIDWDEKDKKRVFAKCNVSPYQATSVLETDYIEHRGTLMDPHDGDYIEQRGTLMDPHYGDFLSKHLAPAHMYSVLSANSRDRTVTLANPHDTRMEFDLKYETFVLYFRRLAGVRLSG